MKPEQIQVQGTNDSSIVSKLSMVNQGYFTDPFIKHFVQKPATRSPLINRCYQVRAASVSYCLNKFLKEKFTESKQIVSLGAGFDTSYFRFKHEGLLSNVKYIEIDFPAVMKRKVALAQNAGLLDDGVTFSSKTINEREQIILRTTDYICVGYDLRYVGEQLELLLTSAGVSLQEPTLFLSEVVLSYLPSEKSSSVLRWISKAFCNAIVIIFEQISPNDSFGVVMCRHFNQIGSPLLTIDDHPTISSHEERHKHMGYNTCSPITLIRFYYDCVNLKERNRIEQLQVFDEFEAWHLACQHYFLLCSTNSGDVQIQRFCRELFPAINVKGVSLLPHTLVKVEKKDVKLPSFGHSIRSYGQCACIFQHAENKDSWFGLVYGGFGIDPHGETSMHKRLDKKLFVVDLKSLKTYACKPIKTNLDDLPKYPMFASVVNMKGLNEIPSVILFGGRSSPAKSTNQVTLLTFEKDSKHSEEKEPSWVYRAKRINPSNTECPRPRWRHSAASLCHSGKTFMIIFGGRDESTIFGDCWSFDVAGEKWYKVTLLGDVIAPRHSHSMCTRWVDETNSLILSGGLGEEQIPFADIFDIHFDFGSAVAHVSRLKISESIPPRYSHSSHVIDEILLMVGGVSPGFNSEYREEGTSDTLDIINLGKGLCSRTIELCDVTSDPVMLHGHSSLLLRCNNESEEKMKHRLVILGGGDNCFSFGTWFNATPISIDLTKYLS